MFDALDVLSGAGSKLLLIGLLIGTKHNRYVGRLAGKALYGSGKDEKRSFWVDLIQVSFINNYHTFFGKIWLC